MSFSFVDPTSGSLYLQPEGNPTSYSSIYGQLGSIPVRAEPTSKPMPTPLASSSSTPVNVSQKTYTQTPTLGPLGKQMFNALAPAEIFNEAYPFTTSSATIIRREPIPIVISR